MVGRDELLRRQEALADFGELVIRSQDLDQILTEGCRLVAEALGADLAKVVEIEREANTGLVRAGVGWRAGIVGKARVDLSARTSEAYAIEAGEPVIVNDITKEDRFEFPAFMLEHGVKSIVNVPIFVPGQKPYGLLQVDAREPRTFGPEDILFLRTYAMVLGPVIDRLNTVTALKHSDERLQLIANNARDYVIVLSDPSDIITDWLAGSEAILGWSADEIVGKPGAVLFTPEDQAAGVPEVELSGAREGGASPDVRWHLRKDGGRVFLDGQTVALKDDAGQLRGYVKIGQDVTERRRNEERQQVLLAELQHRVRNVLAMVRAVVRRTVKSGTTVEEIGWQLEGRIDALARTQALLTRALGVGVDLEQLIREELLAQAARDRMVTIKGPALELAPKAAEVLTLAIHELATNATKYGVLGQEAGGLAVLWSRFEDSGETWLRLEWSETGLKPTVRSIYRQGFGTELITRRVPYELSGRGQIDLRREGLHCVIEFPLVHGESILETRGPPATAQEDQGATG